MTIKMKFAITITLFLVITETLSAQNFFGITAGYSEFKTFTPNIRQLGHGDNIANSSGTDVHIGVILTQKKQEKIFFNYELSFGVQQMVGEAKTCKPSHGYCSSRTYSDINATIFTARLPVFLSLGNEKLKLSFGGEVYSFSIRRGELKRRKITFALPPPPPPFPRSYREDEHFIYKSEPLFDLQINAILGLAVRPIKRFELYCMLSYGAVNNQVLKEFGSKNFALDYGLRYYVN